ncbi:MAG: UDP-N-acetylmuramate dehydrogenase [Planctomycetota bacterium]
MLRVHRHSSLLERTSIRTGGRSRLLAEPEELGELCTLLARLEASGIPYFVLGGGTNTLFPDRELEGAVISMRRLDAVTALGEGVLEAEAGLPLRRLIRLAIRNGWGGLENLVGIPGTVGGAVHGNAGGGDASIGEHVDAVLLLDRRGEGKWVPGPDLPWSYRYSGIGGRVIARVRLRLHDRMPPSELKRAAQRIFERKLRSQPLGARSAGCVFRNPPGESAGRLIDVAGLKGARVGDAQVSLRHANFIVNQGQASGGDVRELMAHVRDRVRDTFGISLDEEIITPRWRWGRR